MTRTQATTARRLIRYEMERIGLSQVELADRLGVTRGYVWSVLHGRACITLDSAARFLAAISGDRAPRLLGEIMSE